MIHSAKKILVAGIVPCLLLMLIACGPNSNMTELEHMRRASIFEKQGDISSAIIEYKNTLKINTANFEARWALGNLQLAISNWPSAEKELRSALNISPGNKKVQLSLARALLQQEKYEDTLSIINENQYQETPLYAKALLVRGKALTGMLQIEEAQNIYKKVIEIEPGNVKATLGLARINIDLNEWGRAQALINSILDILPDNVEAIMLQGDIYRLKGNFGKSISAYTKALDLDPSHIPAYLSRAQTFIQSGNLDPALIDIELIKKYVPNYPVAAYVQALFYFKQGNYDAAYDSVQQVLKVVPKHLPSLLLIASIEYKNGSFETAVQNLDIYLDKKPGDVEARKLLAKSLLNLQKPDLAISALTPVQDKINNDFEAKTILGSAFLQNGNPQQATEILKEASLQSATDPEKQTVIGILQLAGNNEKTAIDSLNSAEQSEDNPTALYVILALSKIKKHDYNSAIKYANAVTKQEPQSPLGEYLIGLAHFINKDYETSKRHIQASLSIQPNYLPAVIVLAQIETSKGTPNALNTRLEELLRKNKANYNLLIRIAQIAENEKKYFRSIDFWEQARHSKPNKIEPYLHLILNFLKTKQPRKALEISYIAQDRHPENPQIIEAKGIAELQSEHAKEAVETFSKLVKNHPQTAQYYFRLYQAQAANNQPIESRESLTNAEKLEPKNFTILATHANLLIEMGLFEESIKLSKKLIEIYPKKFESHSILGDAYANQGDFPDAAIEYEKTYKLNPSRKNAFKLFMAYRQNKQLKKSHTIIERWLTKQPDDAGMRLLLANSYLLDNLSEPAQKEFTEIVKKHPDSAVAQNNLAWLLFKKNDSRALQHAKNAYQIEMNEPSYIDTYAWILINTGNPEYGQKLLQEILSIQPHLRRLRYHLAVAYAKLGQTDKSQTELRRALREGEFDGDREAKALLQTLEK